MLVGIGPAFAAFFFPLLSMLNFYSRLAGAAGVLLLAPGAPALAQAFTITNLTPAANARAVPRNASVVATFSQPLTAASTGALKVFSSQRGGLRGGGTATVAGNALTFAPAAYDFRPGEAVQYTVTTRAAGAGGSLATPRVGQFTTAVRVSTGQFGLGSDPSVGTQPSDTLRTIRRPSQELFFCQRPIVLNNQLCLRCHGEVGRDISKDDYALIQQQFPRDQATGYRLGQTMGAWQISMQRPGVAEFWTMKTRKKWKQHKMPKLF